MRRALDDRLAHLPLTSELLASADAARLTQERADAIVAALDVLWVVPRETPHRAPFGRQLEMS